MRLIEKMKQDTEINLYGDLDIKPFELLCIQIAILKLTGIFDCSKSLNNISYIKLCSSIENEKNIS